MIASPSDVSEARETVHTALTSWNEANTANRGLALVPLRWETSTVPMLGDHPQAIINKQLVEKADIVFALFGSKLGRATAAAASGTAEEIQEAQQAGKPVHLYFSTAPHANDVDPEQLLALREFKEELESRGLYGTFSNPEELNAKVWQAIEHDLQVLGATAPVQSAERAGVDIIAQPVAENQPTTDSRGRVRNKTKRWVELNNRGDVDAFDLTVDSATDGVVIIGPDGPTILHGGQSRRFPMVLTAQAGDPTVTVRWTESGEPKEKTFHVG
ncbi:DUF4062 domain-containing protein [Kocuria sabuli]|uniref:DUF4062 domain-containing protein n=1 Tax=Kocuria sabuli TaxID=3071448 RepID=UPI0036DF1695